MSCSKLEKRLKKERKDYFSVKVLSKLVCVSECFTDIDSCVSGLLSSNGTLEGVSVTLNKYVNGRRTQIPFVRG